MTLTPQTTRWAVALGAALAALGVALVGTAHPGPGGPALLLGWVVLGTSVHRLGREG